jgi:hypothetical protein
MFASNNDARTNATPKTILLDMARSQSAIELRRKPVSSETGNHYRTCESTCSADCWGGRNGSPFWPYAMKASSLISSVSGILRSTPAASAPDT